LIVLLNSHVVALAQRCLSASRADSPPATMADAAAAASEPMQGVTEPVEQAEEVAAGGDEVSADGGAQKKEKKEKGSKLKPGQKRFEVKKVLGLLSSKTCRDYAAAAPTPTNILRCHAMSFAIPTVVERRVFVGLG